MTKANLYVQFGCGFSPGDGWQNFDSSPTLRIERIPVLGPILSATFSGNSSRFPRSVRYGDIVEGLPFSDGTVRGCYASHVLEHLSLSDFHRAVANTFRMLQPGGIFRIIVPDLHERARRYVESYDLKRPDAAATFLRTSHLGYEERPKHPIQYLRHLIGGSMHLWMWDEHSISAELKKLGFVNIRRCQFGDSSDAMFSKVEDKGRFFDENQKISECAIEAQKPK